MTIPRIYFPNQITLNSKITLPKDPSHHLLRVLRIKTGKELILFDGKTQGEYQAKLININHGLAEIEIQKFEVCDRESPLKIHLGQVISRGEKMDFTIQKATELGAISITPLFSERCNVHLDPTRLKRKQEHWQKVAIAASEQSGRTTIPTIYPAEKLAAWINKLNSELKITLSLTQANLNLNNLSTPHNVTLLVGPEGGLTEAEEELALHNDFHAWQLGPRTLRTETAALTAISILQSEFGDFH